MKKYSLVVLFLSAFNAFSQEVNLSSEQLWATSDSSGAYSVFAKQGRWKLYTGASPEHIDWNRKIGTLKRKKFVYKSAKPGRAFFAAVNQKDTVYFSDRRIYMDGTGNFRDLGGIRTSDGKTVAWGKIFRCGDMGKLSGNDLNFIKNAGITDVIDFRTESEIKSSPDQYPADASINRIHAQIGQKDPEEMNKFMKTTMNPAATPTEVERVFTGFYENMITQIKDYKPLFEELLANAGNESILFHCTAGKDRTGLASALILSALNVPEETIVEEYYLSNLYTRKMFAKHPMMSRIKPEIAEVLAGVKPAYIQASLAKIKLKYGSVQKMLESELGLNAEKRALLSRKYTY